MALPAAWHVPDAMTTKYIENTTDSPRYVGGRMIPPGEGRDIDVRYLPPELRDAVDDEGQAVPPALDELLEQLRAKGVKSIAEELAELKLEALERLYELESLADTPRKTLLTAIDAERLRRANAALEAEEADKRRVALEEATAQLAAAKVALDVEADVAKHPELDSAVAEAQARVDALTPALPG